MRYRRLARPQRRPIFLGCEGESERAYGTLLGRLIEEYRHDLHFDVVLLKPGGGDPLTLVERACGRVAENERKRDIRYAIRALLLDADRRGQSSQRDTQMFALAQGERLRLIWQEPCHEALLLRHLEGCQGLRPPSPAVAMEALRRRWPEYVKGTSAVQLAKRISVREVAWADSVKPSLREFLDDIKFPFR
jgi:hypothetical protein